MLVFPNAKINLGLYVTARRSDGYHNLETVFYPIPFCDALEILPTKNEFTFKIWGNEIGGSDSENLCVKAWRMLKERYNIPAVEMHLLKKIPTGAGLGGGSADGAFALRAMGELFSLELSQHTLIEMSLELGSDCPVFIANRPALGKGRGELLEDLPLSLKGMYLILLNPSIHVGTAEAFSQITPKPIDSDWKPNAPPAVSEDWKLVKNVFEPGIFEIYPEIALCKQTLLESGACYASMSGTGSTVFGLFSEITHLHSPISNWIIWKGWI
jgi:4-diphosphocytidyl-2-C-methyl-D-erythritol kinase